MDLFYVAPKSSLDLIMEQGILPPAQVRRLIEEQKLPREVLGISFGNDPSHFPEYVSLVQEHHLLTLIAQQLCFSRHQRFNDPDFMAIGYALDSSLKDDPQFVSHEQVEIMNSCCYPGELLYKGPIDKKYILHRFAVRTGLF
ncbi:MAG: hypothetical protein KC535_01600 [Nanoarchaeota archaeon]|nr:hypothetical protein [Nanoarchaeota archaeon]